MLDVIVFAAHFAAGDVLKDVFYEPAAPGILVFAGDTGNAKDLMRETRQRRALFAIVISLEDGDNFFAGQRRSRVQNVENRKTNSRPRSVPARREDSHTGISAD